MPLLPLRDYGDVTRRPRTLRCGPAAEWSVMVYSPWGRRCHTIRASVRLRSAAPPALGENDHSPHPLHHALLQPVPARLPLSLPGGVFDRPIFLAMNALQESFSTLTFPIFSRLNYSHDSKNNLLYQGKCQNSCSVDFVEAGSCSNVEVVLGSVRCLGRWYRSGWGG